MKEQFSKYVGIAKITDPVEVESQCNTYGFPYKIGSIFCHVPGLGLEGTNHVYCRYGLSFPYFRIQPEWKVLVEPTIIPEFPSWAILPLVLTLTLFLIIVKRKLD